ncbi:hypothetical protein ABKN59_009417 [Abortiporus biennis]
MREMYPHEEEMPYAREPLKSLYTFQRLFTTLCIVPWWVAYYGLLPRTSRPRESWSIKQIIAVNFTRRVYKVAERAGVTWGTRNPDKPCNNRTLKETRFEWVDPLPEECRSGVVVDDQVPFKKVGAFVWPKVKPTGSGVTGNNGKSTQGSPSSFASSSSDPSTLKEESSEPVIGVFLHGGGYCHMSAHETSNTSKIPRRLMKDKAFDEIYAVEYRLLQHAPFPAAIQDAAAVYAHILRQHELDITVSPITSQGPSVAGTPTIDNHLAPNSWLATTMEVRREKHEIKKRVAMAVKKKGCKIILIGDSAGGNLVLGVARWIRDEGILPPPDGLLLLSPSCDPSHAFPESPSSYIPRPHAETDYLVDTPEPRALLQRTFLGHHPLEVIHSPYVSPASQRCLRAFYGDTFATSVEELCIDRMNTRTIDHLRNMESGPPTPLLDIERSPTNLNHPALACPRGMSLFTDFPKVCVVLGDAERLEKEVIKLVGAMERDGVRVNTVWVKDAVHDILMMGWWDEDVRDRVWKDVEDWISQTVA